VARVFKEALLQTARRGGFFILSRRWSGESLRILAYHGIWTTPGFQYGNHLFITPAQFEQRMSWLKSSGYPVLPLAEAIMLMNNDALPENAVVITIDDGWASTYTYMLPVLESLNLPATVYMTTWYSEHQFPICNIAANYLLERAGQPIETRGSIIADIIARPTLGERDHALGQLAVGLGIGDEKWRETRQFNLMTLAEISDACRRGLDFQLHTHSHRWGSVPPDQLSTEIARNRAVLALACSRAEDQFDHFCYPSGRLNPAGDEVLRQYGIKSATMIEQGINPVGTHPYRLRRFLDGRSVSQVGFEAYLSGALEIYETAIRKYRHDAMDGAHRNRHPI
jgi:peptidoglycan/xylan/chitin deacetylase (PgdA/CDA1 family)